MESDWTGSLVLISSQRSPGHEFVKSTLVELILARLYNRFLANGIYELKWKYDLFIYFIYLTCKTLIIFLMQALL